jgi:required for meiotic nuclear division protein 1
MPDSADKTTTPIVAPRPDSRLPAPGRVENNIYHVRVHADYYEGQIDLKQFRARFPHYPVLLSNPLVLEPVKYSYVILARFGAVIFWDCAETIIQDLRAEIKSLPGVLNRNDAVADQLTVHIGGEQDTVTFNDVWLRELTLEKLKIIALVLGQSVALDRFENEVARAMDRFNPVMAALRLKGQLVLSEAEVLQAVGFALEVRAAVLANLTLFDDPPETWESETLAYLDSQLYDQFDLEERLSAINQKLIFLTDINSTLTTLLSNRKSHRLEWIVIALIIVEIILFVLEPIFPNIWQALGFMIHR